MNDTPINRDAVIRGLMSIFWGELGATYDEADKCDGISVYVNDSGRGIPLLDMVDLIVDYSVKSSMPNRISHCPESSG